MPRYTFTTVAQAYGSGVYNSCDYNCNTTANTTAASQSGAGTLANTGIALLSIATLACLIVFVAIIARIARRRRQRSLADDNVPAQRDV